jgi:hypothetical protein
MPDQQQDQLEQEAGEPSDENSPLAIRYGKSPQYRVIFANGFMIGTTLSGEIHLAAWNDHPPYPTSNFLKFSVDGEKGKEVTGERSGISIEREIEIGIVLRPEAAVNLLRLLADLLASIGVISHVPTASDQPRVSDDRTPGEADHAGDEGVE